MFAAIWALFSAEILTGRIFSVAFSEYFQSLTRRPHIDMLLTS
jgi:hypothetical protein